MIYNAIRMSSADGVYAEAERETVKKAANLLGVGDDIVLTLESLVGMEKSVVNIRRALFNIDTL